MSNKNNDGNPSYSDLVEELVPDGISRVGRKVWVRPASVAPTGMLVFLDAELYIERVGSPTIVSRLEESGDLPATLSEYISNGGSEARHINYTCSAEFADFVVFDLLVWIKGNYPKIILDEVAIIGLSLSGLQAAYIAQRHQSLFRAAICQSPSFWWEGERFLQTIRETGEPKSRFWVSVGDKETQAGLSHSPTGLRQETSQIDACSRTADRLKESGYDLNYRIFHGGHDPECWRADLADALPWVWKAKLPE